MKKTLTILVLGSACAAWLFAQNVQQILESKNDAPSGPAAVEQPATEPAAAAAPSAEEPVAADMPAAVVIEPSPQPSPAPEQEVQTDEIAIADDLMTGSEMASGLVSLSLKDVELQDVIRLFGKLSGANIIIPDLGEEVSAKKVYVNLSGVEWKPSLQAILDTHGLELYEKIPGTEVYSIREKAADAPEPLLVKVYKLNFATVDGVAEMVKEMVPEPGKVSVFPARNTIVVQSTAANQMEVNDIISAIDLPRQQVFIEAKFMELEDSASEKLGIDWQVLGGYGVGLSGIGGSYGYTDSKSDTINNSRTRNWSDSTSDSRSLTQSRFADIAGNPYEVVEGDDFAEFPARAINNPDYIRIFGLTPTTSSESLAEALSTTLNDSLSTITSLDQSTVSRALGATLSADDFRLVLAALKETGGTKVVSNPKVIVANEETATIHIGREKPNVKGTIQTAGDSQSTTTYELDPTERYFKDGIMVDVTPTINTTSNITVKIQPTLDRLDALPFVAPDGTEFYGKTTKKIDTLFSLESGQTAAIGGLTQNSSDEVERKVPLLGSIPLLGRLFRYSSKVSGQTETIIFVTVGLANPDGINMETGLPQESRLAMRYDAQARTDRAIRAEEQKIFQQEEDERLQRRLDTLRATQQKQLESQEKE